MWYFLNWINLYFRYLLTPVSNPRTAQEERYNKVQIKSRNSVERLFGVWKRRFPYLHIGLATKLSTTANIIIACAVLHNIAVEANDIFEIDDTVDYGAHCTQSSASTIANTTGTSDGLVLQNN